MRPTYCASFALCLALASQAFAARCVMRGHCSHNEDVDKDIPCKVDEEPQALSDKQLFEEVCPDLAATTDVTCCDVEQLQALKKDLQKAIDVGIKRYPSCLRNFRNIFCQFLCSPKQSEFVKVVDSKDTDQDTQYVTKVVYAISEQFAKGAYDSCKNVKVHRVVNLMTMLCGWWCDPVKFFTVLGSTASEGGHSPYKVEPEITTDATIHVAGTELWPLNVDVV